MHSDEFFASARSGKNDFWRYFLTVIGIVFIVIFVTAIVAVAVSIYFFTTHNIDFNHLSPIASLLIGMSIFPPALLVLFLGIRFLHQRPFKTLITPQPRIAWRRMLLSGGLWFLISAIGDLVTALWVTPGNYSWSFNPIKFIPFAILSVILIPIQSSTEELVFRGYLMQAFSLLTKHPWIPLVVSSVLFASLHSANPEVATYGFAWMIPIYLGMGLLLGWITQYTGGLEASMGLHIANNLYAGLIVTFPDSAIVSPAVFTINHYDVKLSLVSFVVSAALYLVLFIWLNGKHKLAGESEQVAPVLNDQID
ncbi:MAG: type II CAAX endopeptidase family protein [Anaerolineaceae bacterium]|nr:type II CAAX endopeptidase family protein [Anaerolineaceae bacterium]